jgi:hypothetical protein
LVFNGDFVRFEVGWFKDASEAQNLNLATRGERRLTFDARDNGIDVEAPVRQVPSRRETRRARVSAPAKNDDVLAAALPAEHLEGEHSGGASGVLRELKDIDAEFFLGDTLDSTHLLGRNPRHLSRLPLGQTARVCFHRHRRARKPAALILIPCDRS